jgi:putative transposase
LPDGTKELIAVADGERESNLSWLDVLRHMKARGETTGPAVAVGDGGLGFWAAMAEEYPGTREQRCWVHETANVLGKLPKTLQPTAKDKIHQMYLAPTKEAAQTAFATLHRRP